MRINWPNFSRCKISEGNFEYPGEFHSAYMPRIITGPRATRVIAFLENYVIIHPCQFSFTDLTTQSRHSRAHEFGADDTDG